MDNLSKQENTLLRIESRWRTYNMPRIKQTCKPWQCVIMNAFLSSLLSPLSFTKYFEPCRVVVNESSDCNLFGLSFELNTPFINYRLFSLKNIICHMWWCHAWYLLCVARNSRHTWVRRQWVYLLLRDLGKSFVGQLEWPWTVKYIYTHFGRNNNNCFLLSRIYSQLLVLLDFQAISWISFFHIFHASISSASGAPCEELWYEFSSTRREGVHELFIRLHVPAPI